jgi:hypothetical protein
VYPRRPGTPDIISFAEKRYPNGRLAGTQREGGSAPTGRGKIPTSKKKGRRPSHAWLAASRVTVSRGGVFFGLRHPATASSCRPYLPSLDLVKLPGQFLRGLGCALKLGAQGRPGRQPL